MSKKSKLDQLNTLISSYSIGNPLNTWIFPAACKNITLFASEEEKKSFLVLALSNYFPDQYLSN